jgi:multiple sugar transport system ATP-binding protein
VAKMVRIHHKLDNRSTKLSGGEMQRVAIGRALVRKPAIYLMDEPLSSLDAKLRADLRLELKRIQAELGATMLYVTHDQIEAMTMADRIGILADGVLVQIGTPRTIYSEPANLHVAARLGQPAINLLPTGLLPDGDMPAGTKTIGARTEHLSIGKASNGNADGIVDWVEHLGDQNHLHVTVGTKKLVTLTDPETQLEKGDKVTIRYRAPLFFDQAGNRIANR